MNRQTNMQMLQPQFVQVEVSDVDQPYIVYADWKRKWIWKGKKRKFYRALVSFLFSLLSARWWCFLLFLWLVNIGLTAVIIHIMSVNIFLFAKPVQFFYCLVSWAVQNSNDWWFIGEVISFILFFQESFECKLI